jgi:HPt (histidine-containing phosphotransfer) domain-containing protein
MDADRRACLAAGMRDHVAKPVDLDQLVACLLRHVGPVVESTAAASSPGTPLLDRAAALRRLGGQQALYDRLLASFAQGVPAEMDALRRHLRQASVPDAVRVLHTLRGLAAAVGADALAAMAGAQEQAVRGQAGVKGADPDALQRLLARSLAALAPAPQARRRRRRRRLRLSRRPIRWKCCASCGSCWPNGICDRWRCASSWRARPPTWAPASRRCPRR